MNFRARFSVFGGRDITDKIYNNTYNLRKLLCSNFSIFEIEYS